MSWWGHWFGKSGSSTPVYLNANILGTVAAPRAANGSVVTPAVSGVSQLTQEIQAGITLSAVVGSVQNGLSVQATPGVVHAVTGRVANLRQAAGAVTIPEVNGQV